MPRRTNACPRDRPSPPADCIAATKAMARGDEVAMQTNRFNPTDPFTATDPAEKYDSRDPKTGEPSVAIEITMSRK